MYVVYYIFLGQQERGDIFCCHDPYNLPRLGARPSDSVWLVPGTLRWWEE